MQRFTKIYSKTAIIVFNTILLALCALWILDVAFDLRYTLMGRSNVIHSDQIDISSFQLVPSETAKKIAKEYDRWGSDQPFTFNPWTTFMTAPFSGPFINVKKDEVLNYRTNATTRPGSNRLTEKPFVVWAFGGSTMFGYGVSDSLTVPSFLEQKLAQYIKNRPIQVINFGQPYWYSSVETAAYSALLKSGLLPNVVIFLDGLNDLSWRMSGYTVPVFAARAEAAWDHQRKDAKRQLPWVTLNESFPVARFIKALNYYRNTQPVASDVDPFRAKQIKTAAALYNDMRINYEMVRVLSEKFGIKPYIFLQPVPWFGNYDSPVNTEFHFGSRDIARKTYQRLIEATDGELSGLLFDLSDRLERLKKPYLDSVHYSDAANQHLADNMADIISRTAVPR